MTNEMLALLRALKREKLYAAINIAGLALGIACALVLGLFLRSELTYDRHFSKHERIYRIVDEFVTAANIDRTALTSHMLGPMLAADYPQIKAYVRFQSNSGDTGVAIHHGNDTYYWKDSYFVDDNVFEVFDHHILFGDPKTALKDGASVAVSETFARKYFGNTNPIGQTITTDAGLPGKITLVFADLPVNTHLKYDILFSGNAPFLRDEDNPTLRRQALWGIGSFTYILTAPGFDPGDWARINREFYARYMAPYARPGSQWRSWLQPLTSIHLQAEVGEDLPTGNRLYLYGCSAVALFILLVAGINYTNLATARAAGRARSVGIRKILGANRLSLGLHFLTEALLFSLIALVLGVALVELLLTLTPMNSIMGEPIHLRLGHDPELVGWLIAVGVLVGLISGAYPAIYLSGWAPTSAMTGKQVVGKANLRLRESLVLLQFTISAAVIACTLLMSAQMRYIANKPLGFDKDNRLVVNLRGAETIEKLTTIRTELVRDAHILGVTEANAIMGQATPSNVIQVENDAGVLVNSQTAHMPIGEDFVKVMGLRIARGHDFSRRLLTDIGTNFLVNESFVRQMAWSEPLGKRIELQDRSGKVIGVVRDFNFKSLHSPVEPFLMYPLSDDFSSVPQIYRPFQQRLLVIDISGSDLRQTLDYVERVITQVDSKHPFQYAFLDDSLDRMYKAEHQLMRLTSVFAVVCIFIACLGLFGLAAFTTEQRGREIATRKVLGATAWQIITLLSGRVLVLVVVGAAIAAAIAYMAMDEWLTGFAYRAGINPLVFLVSAVASAAVAFTTIALQSFKTANSDPADALREI
jgi:putative ABC transport system permease protein